MLFHPQSRAELLIAMGRIILSAFFLLAVLLDPPDPHHYASFTYWLLSGYLGYSLLLGATVWHFDFSRHRQRLLSHAIDLMVFAVIMFLTEGSNSPFFVYLIFLLVCATLRWQWRGTLLTAIASISIMTALALLPANQHNGSSFELNRFLIRIIYLAVIATMLGYLGKHEQSMRTMFYKLAEWPRAVPAEIDNMTEEILAYAAGILKAPRLVLIWEEEVEPWLYTACWSRDGVSHTREHPQVFGNIIARELAGSSFLCQDIRTPATTMVHAADGGIRRWNGSPLDDKLSEHFGISAILSARISGDSVSGYMLALDKPMMTQDDLMLGEIIAHEVEARLEHYQLLVRIRQTAAAEERIRLARDLHDGVLQSLTGASLQLETVQMLLESGNIAARQRIQEIQKLLSGEQKDLRSHINELRPYAARSMQEEFRLRDRLSELAERIRQQWDHSVAITLPPAIPQLSRSMAREVYFVIHEAMFNAARHADATAIQAELCFTDNMAIIKVDDNGHGFTFHGSYDQAQLSEMKRGPVTLRERIAALHGTLAIDSATSGATLRITLPLTDFGG